MNNEQVTKELIQANSWGADLHILIRSFLRNIETSVFFKDFIEYREIALKTGTLIEINNEIKRRIKEIDKKYNHSFTYTTPYEILQVLDYYDSDTNTFELALSKILSHQDINLKENLGSCLPLILSKLGKNRAIEILSACGQDFYEIQTSNAWLSAVCNQPLFLLNYCQNNFIDICRKSKSHHGYLAQMLHDIFISKRLSKESINNFFSLKDRYKRSWLKALRRYTGIFPSIPKDIERISQLSSPIKTGLDLIFSSMIGIKPSAIEFNTLYIKNSLELQEEELAFCFSRLNIKAKHISTINKSLTSKGISKIQSLHSNSISSLYQSIIDILPDSPINSESKFKEPLVSVIFTTRNPNLELLNLAIKSIKAQTHKRIEIIIIDDYSEDPTSLKNIANGYEDITLFRSDNNIGTYAARNIALDISKGEYIAFQDDDDVSHPQRIEYQLSQMHNFNAQVMTVSHIRFDKFAMLQIDNGTNIISDGPVTMVIKRSVFDSVGKFLPLRSRGDIEFRTRCKRKLSDNLIIHENIPLYYAYGSHQTLSSDFEYKQYSKLELQRLMFATELI